MQRYYLNRVPGEERTHVEFLPVDVADVLADLKNAPALTARTQKFVAILEEVHRYFQGKEG
jgi:hypothetical protein